MYGLQEEKLCLAWRQPVCFLIEPLRISPILGVLCERASEVPQGKVNPHLKDLRNEFRKEVNPYQLPAGRSPDVWKKESGLVHRYMK